MRRRDFFTTAALAGGALALGSGCGRKIEQKSDTLAAPLKTGESAKFITEPPRSIPVFAETDVLVIGGGPAGTAAAIAASKTGADIPG